MNFDGTALATAPISGAISSPGNPKERRVSTADVRHAGRLADFVRGRTSAVENRRSLMLEAGHARR
jgi:hypothetical protein